MSEDNSFIELPKIKRIKHGKVLSSQKMSYNIPSLDKSHEERNYSSFDEDDLIKSTSVTNSIRKNSALSIGRNFIFFPMIPRNLSSLKKAPILGKKNCLNLKYNFSTKCSARAKSNIVSLPSNSVNESEIFPQKSHIDLAHENDIQLVLDFARKFPYLKFDQPLSEEESKEVENFKLHLNYASSPFFLSTPFYKYEYLNHSNTNKLQENNNNNFIYKTNLKKTKSIDNIITNIEDKSSLRNIKKFEFNKKLSLNKFAPLATKPNNEKKTTNSQENKKKTSLGEIEEYKSILKKINQHKGIDKEVVKRNSVKNKDDSKKVLFPKEILEKELRIILNNERSLFINDLKERYKIKEKITRKQLALNKFIRSISVNKKPPNYYVDGYSLLDGQQNKQVEEYNNILGSKSHSREQKKEKLIKYYKCLEDYEDKKKKNIEKLLNADKKYKQLFIPNIDLDKEKMERIKNNILMEKDNILVYKLFKNSKIIRNFKNKK